MRFFLVVLICHIPSLTLALEILNEDLGAFHTHAKVGLLPLKYEPLNLQDQYASKKVMEMLDVVHIPGYPNKIDSFDPVGIDIKFFRLKGQVILKNVEVTGIPQMIVNSAELQLSNIRQDLNVTFPQLGIEADFKLQAHVSIFPIVLSFHISTNWTGLNIAVSAGAVVGLSPIGPVQVLQLAGAETLVDIQNVKVSLTNIELGGAEDKVTPNITQLFVAPNAGGGDLYYYLLYFALRKTNNILQAIPAVVLRDLVVPIHHGY